MMSNVAGASVWNQLILPLLWAGLAFGGALLLAWLTPEPYRESVGTVIFVLLFTGVLPMAIYGTFKRFFKRS
jgi:membrane protease YdiL (CAAX protease family)